MPGSKDDPLVLDQYQTIVEVGWPGAIAVKTNVYIDVRGPSASSIACSPPEHTTTFIAAKYIISSEFMYRNPSDDANEVRYIRELHKWNSKEKNWSGGGLDIQRAHVANWPDFKPKESFGAWMQFAHHIDWEPQFEGDSSSKYFVPGTHGEEIGGVSMRWFNPGANTYLKKKGMPIGGPLGCHAPGVYGGSLSADPVDANLQEQSRETLDFTNSILKLGAMKEVEGVQQEVFQYWKPYAMQILPNPRVAPQSTEPEVFKFDKGPAEVWLLMKRAKEPKGALFVKAVPAPAP